MPRKMNVKVFNILPSIGITVRCRRSEACHHRCVNVSGVVPSKIIGRIRRISCTHSDPSKIRNPADTSYGRAIYNPSFLPICSTLATLHAYKISSVDDLLEDISNWVLSDYTLLKLQNYLFYEILQDICDAVKVETLELTREAPLYATCCETLSPLTQVNLICQYAKRLL